MINICARALRSPSSPSRNRQPAAAPGSALRRARRIALAAGGFLIPWTVLVAATLPSETRVRHWSIAWAGLDAGEAIAALATAELLAREDRRAAITAASGGALLLADAWFDVCTCAPGRDRARALSEAIAVELPLAAAAFWLAATLTGDTAGPPLPVTTESPVVAAAT